MVRTAFLSKFQRGFRAIDHDDFRSAEGLQYLNADVPQSAGANHDGKLAG